MEKEEDLRERKGKELWDAVSKNEWERIVSLIEG